MKQQAFEQLHSEFWQALEEELATKKHSVDKEFPSQYRALCQHLAVAKSRQYTSALINRLNRLVVSGHHILYEKKKLSEAVWVHFLLSGFPVSIRKNKRFVFLAGLLFLVPLLIMAIGCYINNQLVYSFMAPYGVTEFESMYDPSGDVLGRERKSDTDLMMFGYYIKNNIGIGFRTFASGILFGLGSIFFLIYNGIHIGGVAGHLTQLGYTETFYGFVTGHGAFELTAIVFCGAAGLKLGFSLLDPGSKTRIDALRSAGREAALIVYGSALMLLIAAFIEAFWSSSNTIPLSIKYSVGGVFALLLILYFCFSGRRYEP